MVIVVKVEGITKLVKRECVEIGVGFALEAMALNTILDFREKELRLKMREKYYCIVLKLWVMDLTQP